MSTPIPVELKEGFLTCMKKVDNEDLSDAGWLLALESTASDFMSDNYVDGDPELAVHQYLIWRS